MKNKIQTDGSATVAVIRLQPGDPFTFPDGDGPWIRTDEDLGSRGVAIVRVTDGHRVIVGVGVMVVPQDDVYVGGKLRR